MRDATDPPVAPREPESADRRGASDRRESAGEGRRHTPEPRRNRWFKLIGRDALIIAASVSTIVFTVNRIHPIFANQPKVVESLTREIPAAKAFLTPEKTETQKDTGRLGQLVSTPE